MLNVTWSLQDPKSVTSNLRFGQVENIISDRKPDIYTLKRIQEKYFWPKMIELIIQIIAACMVCQQF